MADLNDISKDLVLKVEETKITIKEIINSGIKNSTRKDIIKIDAIKVIDAFENEVNKLNSNYKKFARDSRRVLVKCFTQWYGDFLKVLAQASLINPIAKERLAFINKETPKEYLEQVKAKPFILGNDPSGLLETDTKFKWSSGESGYSQMQIEDYSKLVNNEIDKLLGKKLVSKEMKNGKVMNLSVRNLAECTVRYDHHQKELQTLREQNTKLVLVSQHHDASERCRKWQGRLYSLDGTSGKTNDSNGLLYMPLENATKDHQLFGYNCRHRLIKYIPNMYVPKAIDKYAVKRKRSVDETQRRLERKIRECKELQLSDDPLVRKKAREDSKRLQEYYQKFSKDNGVPHYPWRCSIGMEERSYKSFGKAGLNVEGYEPKTSDEEVFESEPAVLNNVEDVKVDKQVVIEKHTTCIEFEKQLTPKLSEIINTNKAKLIGLEYRLKTIESLTDKVTRDVLENKEKGLKFTTGQILNKIYDVNRYTCILSVDNFYGDYSKICSSLSKEGYELFREKDTFQVKGAQYKGVNDIFKSKDGNFFELQFHTKESFDLKQLTHAMYEESRNPNTSKQRKNELQELMKKESEKLTIPKKMIK